MASGILLTCLMQDIAHKPHIHIIDSDPDTSGALTCMLESHKLDVDCYANAEDLMRSDSINEDDVIIVELDEKRPPIFQFLHRLIYQTVRPGIIIACQKASSVEASDLF